MAGGSRKEIENVKSLQTEGRWIDRQSIRKTHESVLHVYVGTCIDEFLIKHHDVISKGSELFFLLC